MTARRIPPGKSIDGWWTIIQSGLWRLLYKLHKEARIRSTKEFIPLLHDTMEMVLGDRSKKCYYLVYLGTRPGSERKGYGRKLLEHVTAMVS